MEGMNPDVVVFGLVGAALTVFLSIAFLFGVLNPSQKAMRQRIIKLRGRYAPNPRHKTADAARRLLINARDSSFDDLLKRILPRPAELRQRFRQEVNDPSAFAGAEPGA